MRIKLKKHNSHCSVFCSLIHDGSLSLQVCLPTFALFIQLRTSAQHFNTLNYFKTKLNFLALTKELFLFSKNSEKIIKSGTPKANGQHFARSGRHQAEFCMSKEAVVIILDVGASMAGAETQVSQPPMKLCKHVF